MNVFFYHLKQLFYPESAKIRTFAAETKQIKTL